MVYLIIFLVIIFIIYIAVHSKNKQTEEQNIKEIKNRFYNNENVNLWAKTIAECIEKETETNLKQIFFHFRIFNDKLLFGKDLTGDIPSFFDKDFEIYFSKYNLPNLNNTSQYCLATILPILVINKLQCAKKYQFKDTGDAVFMESNANMDDSYFSSLIFEPEITGKW